MKLKINLAGDMSPKLLEVIKDAVNNNAQYVLSHFKRTNPNDHSQIKKFQEKIRDYLELNTEWKWEEEQSLSDESKVSVDILGNLNAKKCIIEIDTVRHDQISAKFVSRLALAGLKESIDYVAILYDSTQKSGPQQAQTYIGYMANIMHHINRKSTVTGIYIQVDKNSGIHKVYIWPTSPKKVNICLLNIFKYLISRF